MKKIVRVTIPRNAAKLIVLAYKILAKHLADGASSILNLLNMAELQNKTDIANTQHTIAEQKSKDAETATEDRDIVLGSYRADGIIPGTVVHYITWCRDVLLGVYKGNEHHLGDWSFEVNTSGGGVKVIIPTYAPDIITLAKAILAKHLADGASSPLNNLDMADMQTKTNTAETKHNLSKTLKEEAEEAIQERDLALGHANEQSAYTPFTVQFYVCAARDILLGVYRGNERELHKWGFNVDTTLPPPPAPQTTITLATNQTNPTPVNIALLGGDGQEVVADYGNNTTETKTVNSSTYTLFSILYNIAGNYAIKLMGNAAAFLELFVPDAKITAINLPEGINISALDLLNNLLTSFFLPLSCINMINLQLNNNALDQQSINQILIQLAANGLSNGMVNLAGGTNAAPSGQAIAAMNQLIARGWNVITN